MRVTGQKLLTQTNSEGGSQLLFGGLQIGVAYRQVLAVTQSHCHPPPVPLYESFRDPVRPMDTCAGPAL